MFTGYLGPTGILAFYNSFATYHVLTSFFGDVVTCLNVLSFCMIHIIIFLIDNLLISCLLSLFHLSSLDIYFATIRQNFNLNTFKIIFKI